MNIGVNKNIDPKIISFYDSFYDILRTPDLDDFDNKTRLLKPEHGIHTIGSPHNKKCRFCGKGQNEVNFTKTAHAFPESIGNHALATNYECDICNEFFGDTIENEFANFFILSNSIMQIDGKNGIPKCNYKIPCEKRTDECANYCIEISQNNGIPNIRLCKEVDNRYINLTKNSITISKPVGKCCPIAVYKALVKMAITVMPIEELRLFSNAISWILNPEHSNFYNDKNLLVQYKMIPGFTVTKYPHYVLYRRKTNDFNKPYMLFNLTYSCYSLLIEVPRDADNCPNFQFENLPFPPIPFYTTTSGIWNLSENETPKNLKHSITLNFDNIKDITE